MVSIEEELIYLPDCSILVKISKVLFIHYFYNGSENFSEFSEWLIIIKIIFFVFLIISSERKINKNQEKKKGLLWNKRKGIINWVPKTLNMNH